MHRSRLAAASTLLREPVAARRLQFKGSGGEAQRLVCLDVVAAEVGQGDLFGQLEQAQGRVG